MSLPATMRAIRKVAPLDGRDGTRLEEIPVPRPGPGEAVVKVLATAVCGTDKHIWHWDPSVAHAIELPRTYGHEFCGEIAALGPGVVAHGEGDYVSAEMHVVCNSCRACRAGQQHACERTRILGLHGEGCFADYVAVPAANLVKLPRSIPPRTGAFLDALGNAVHTTQYVRGGLKGATVAVLGYGPIGAMCVAIAHHCGAERVFVIDVSRHAIDRAEAWKKLKSATAVHIVDASTTDPVAAVRELNGGLVDAAFEMSGHPKAINQALALARFGGHVALLGLPKDPRVTIESYARDLVFKGLDVQAIIGRQMFATWDRMLALLASGLDVSFVVSETYPGLEHFAEGMEAFDRGDAQKVAFFPHGPR